MANSSANKEWNFKGELDLIISPLSTKLAGSCTETENKFLPWLAALLGLLSGLTVGFGHKKIRLRAFGGQRATRGPLTLELSLEKEKQSASLAAEEEGAKEGRAQ